MTRPLSAAQVAKLGELYTELEQSRAAQRITQAKMIRACVVQLRRESPEVMRRSVPTMQEIRDHRDARIKALTYLDMLATMLEDDAPARGRPRLT